MMANSVLSKWAITLSFLVFNSLGIYAQEKSFEPKSGQAGKDVIWVPTPQVLVDKMLDMAHVTSKDYVMDLGSGDGRLVISAAKRGATAVGIEYNPEMVKYSKEKAAEAGVSDKAKFLKADLFQTDLSKATVITLFLLPKINLELRPSLLELKPGTRIVSNSFDMGDWEPDEDVTVTEGCNSGFCRALLWIVPAKVEGKWKVNDGELVLKQKYQKITGTFNNQNITRGHVNGNEISFNVDRYFYKGSISGDQIHGSITLGNKTKEWTAMLK